MRLLCPLLLVVGVLLMVPFETTITRPLGVAARSQFGPLRRAGRAPIALDEVVLLDLAPGLIRPTARLAIECTTVMVNKSQVRPADARRVEQSLRTEHAHDAVTTTRTISLPRCSTPAATASRR
jgi:hypothetical protein